MHRRVGSEWHRWDLHVHTPATLVNNQYGGDTDEAWESFLTDLESIPPSFKVLGINDYLFLDGYRRVVNAREEGRLSNIELVLPVVELRLDKFGGTEGKLSRVNFHAIFSNALSPAVIESQFINTLKVEARLHPSPSDGQPSFKGVVTRESVEDFGKAIIETVPPGERKNFGDPLIEGFNALNFTLDSVREALSSTYFHKKVLTAVGKTEWWDLKWNSQSVAAKKDIINGVDFVFTAADGGDACARSHQQLSSSGVNNRLLDCSDAHHFSTSAEKDRIGNCCTWICADTEFEGLRQVRKEPEGRIYLGEEPPARRRLREAPRRVIRTVKIDRATPSSDGHSWFENIAVDLNPALVAIIGRKGSGKSALVDTLGLLGYTTRMDHASFLNEERFRSGKLAKEFRATLEWHDGDSTDLLLSDDPPEGAVSEVNYVPQDFFEEICNELVGSQGGQFDQELKNVIFSWVADEDRLGMTSLNDLLSYHVEETESSIHRRRGELAKINAAIVGLRAYLKPAAERELRRSLEMKYSELRAHFNAKPAVVPQPELPTTEAPDDGVTNLSRDLEAAERAEADARSRRSDVVAQELRVQRLKKRLEVLRESVTVFLSESAEELEALNLEPGQILEFAIHLSPLEHLSAELGREKEELDVKLNSDEDDPGELVAATRSARDALEAAQRSLEAPAREYEEYLESLRQWRIRRDRLIGSPQEPASLRGIAYRCRAQADFPSKIEALEAERRKMVEAIYEDISSVARVYRSIYRPVQSFIDAHPLVADEFQLRFDVSIEPSRFKERFLQRIHHGRMGTFMGKAEGGKELDKIVRSHDFDTTEGALAFIDDLLDALRADHTRPGTPSRAIEEQLVEGETVEGLLNFITALEYLSPRYRLRLGDRPIEQLSPGEKGALLLVFYLLVDKGQEPLIIDQPEGNLDNETVYSLLVPSIKSAKTRRQVIIVTHNPNLAVVCDAEQIIIAGRTADNNIKIDYLSGGIENEKIRAGVVKILEGTKPAFMNREQKYLR